MVEQRHREIRPGKLRQRRGVGQLAEDQQAVRVVAAQRAVHVTRRARLRARLDGDQQVETGLSRRRFDAAQDREEELAAHFRQQQADRAGLAAGQMAGGGLGHEPQVVDRLLHAVSGLVTHPGGAVEHAADRGDRDSCSFGHVGDGGVPGHSLKRGHLI